MFLSIFAINKIIFQGEVSAVFLPGVEGDLMILPDHAPLLTFLKSGQIRIETKDGGKNSWEVEMGILEVRENEVAVLM